MYLKPFPPDSLDLTPPGGGGGGGGERAEGGQGGQPVVRELWFIVVMTGIALLLLAVILGVMLHKVRDSCFVLYSVSSVTARGRDDPNITGPEHRVCCAVQCDITFGSPQQIAAKSTTVNFLSRNLN